MTVCSYSLTKYTCFIENYFSLALFWIFSFKIDCITLDPDLNPNWAKSLDPDPNSMYLDPQHWSWWLNSNNTQLSITTAMPWPAAQIPHGIALQVYLTVAMHHHWLTIMNPMSTWLQGGFILKEKSFIVPNCCRSPIPKFNVLMLPFHLSQGFRKCWPLP